MLDVLNFRTRERSARQPRSYLVWTERELTLALPAFASIVHISHQSDIYPLEFHEYRVERTGEEARTRTTMRSENWSSRRTAKVRHLHPPPLLLLSPSIKTDPSSLPCLTEYSTRYIEYAQVLKMLGNGRVEAQCFDGTKRLAHIRGKMRKKVWINQGDIVLLSLRDFQDDKADVIVKYTPDEVRGEMWRDSGTAYFSKQFD
jgi:initiation factor 1A